jgi:hypothetical protein
MTKRKHPVEPMHFLNIDLEIGSKRSLAPLIAEMGAKRNVSVMYVGRFGGLARAHYEVHLDVHDADKNAMALVRLVNGLSAPAMKAWRNARLRDFDIGIQSSGTPTSLAVPLAAKTVAAIGALGARIVITVYAPVESRPSFRIGSDGRVVPVERKRSKP